MHISAGVGGNLTAEHAHKTQLNIKMLEEIPWLLSASVSVCFGLALRLSLHSCHHATFDNNVHAEEQLGDLLNYGRKCLYVLPYWKWERTEFIGKGIWRFAKAPIEPADPDQRHLIGIISPLKQPSLLLLVLKLSPRSRVQQQQQHGDRLLGCDRIRSPDRSRLCGEYIFSLALHSKSFLPLSHTFTYYFRDLFCV